MQPLTRKGELITSASNPLLKDVRKALARGTLTSEGYCVAETIHLLEEAIRSARPVHTVIAAENKLAAMESQVRSLPDARLIIVPDKLLDATAAVETSQGVVALVEPPQWTLDRILCGNRIVLVVDGVQDPGNLGAIVRSAEAFNAAGLLLLGGTVSPFNSKALRASAGSIFRVPFAGLDEASAIAALKDSSIHLYAAVPNSRAMPLHQADLTRRCAIVIGSESHGVSHRILESAAGLSIPTAGVESLNAAIAAAILLYEASRQRAQLS